MSKTLVGCIKSISQFGLIKTRFFFVDFESGDVRDVTLELCDAITVFNKEADKVRSTGKYALRIPYKYKDGVAVYSNGCGLSHYFHEKSFEAVARSGKLSFPLTDCRLSMYTPSDVRSILSCRSVFHEEIIDALRERFFHS